MFLRPQKQAEPLRHRLERLGVDLSMRYMATNLLWQEAIFVDGPRRDGPLKLQPHLACCG